jgi:hypothetical protein
MARATEWLITSAECIVAKRGRALSLEQWLEQTPDESPGTDAAASELEAARGNAPDQPADRST